MRAPQRSAGPGARELVPPHSLQLDPGADDPRVQAEILRDASDADELLGCEGSSCHRRDHGTSRVGSDVLLRPLALFLPVRRALRDRLSGERSEGASHGQCAPLAPRLPAEARADAAEGEQPLPSERREKRPLRHADVDADRGVFVVRRPAQLVRQPPSRRDTDEPAKRGMTTRVAHQNGAEERARVVRENDLAVHACATTTIGDDLDPVCGVGLRLPKLTTSIPATV